MPIALLALAMTADPDADRLALAATALDRGDANAAIVHLSAHVRVTPTDAMARSFLAELLFKRGDRTAARDEYERFVAAAQPLDGPVRHHLVHAHTRLMTLAESAGDRYREELHRGVGMYRLVLKWDAGPTPTDPALVDETLAKAAAALRAARAERPTDARAAWYLSRVYARLGQVSAAKAMLRAAKAAQPHALTAWEADRLAAGDP